MTAKDTPRSQPARVQELVRRRLDFVLGLAKNSFAGQEAARIRLGDVKLTGIELDGEEDTVSRATHPTPGGSRSSDCGSRTDSGYFPSPSVHISAAGYRSSSQKPTRGAQATVTCHLEVTPSCCNIRGNAHGGFLAWLVDQCSSLSLLALSGPGERWVSSGVSTNLNVYYISGAPATFAAEGFTEGTDAHADLSRHVQAGTQLAITTSVLQQGRVTGLLETRITDEATGKLVCFATHVKQDPVGGAPFPDREKLEAMAHASKSKL
ncbi:hypothetical protein JCM8202v2_000802 [Rhodotorula sphaerocarpa]